MLKKVDILALLFLLSLPVLLYGQETVVRRSTVVEQYKGSPYYLHFVKPGETIDAIAAAYNVSRIELMAENEFLQKGLKADQVLRIPQRPEATKITDAGNQQAEKSVTPAQVYIVKKKETLYGISKQFHITVEELLKANPGITTLQEGMELTIPVAGETQKATPEDKPVIASAEKTEKNMQWVKVQAGQTAYSISKSYQITVEKFYELNPEAREGLKADQLVKVPALTGQETEVKPDPGQASPLKDDAKNAEILKNKPEIVPAKMPEACLDPSHGTKTYQIALLLPLALEEADSILVQTDESSKPLEEYKTFDYFQFYCGLKMAADSLEKLGFKAKIYVYDADSETDTLKIKKVLQKSEMSKMDLIIGPLFVKSFDAGARFAKKHKINIVNPLSRRDKIVEDNPYIVKAQPSEASIAHSMGDYFKNNYKDANLILIRNGVKELSGLYETLLADLQSEGGIPAGRLQKVNYAVDGFSGVTKKLSADRKNVVVMISSNRSHVPNFVSLLNNYGKGKDITLWGVPGWENLEIESEFLQNLNFHQFTTAFVDYESEDVKSFIKAFRQQYNTEPLMDQQAFLGFDLGFYLLNSLMKFGPEFGNCIPSYTPNGLQYNFHFQQASGSDGFQNTYSKLICIKDYRWVEVK